MRLYCLGHMLQGRDRILPRHRRPHSDECRHKFVDNFVIPELRSRSEPESHHFRPSGNRDVVDRALPHHGQAPVCRSGGIHSAGRRTHYPAARAIVYMFCGIPFTSRTKLEGHAVRAMYACCGATDYYLETGDPAYWKTLNALWEDLSKRQMYITGGVGARAQGRGFWRAI